MLTMTAILSAIAFILAFLEFPVPLSPPFVRMDMSDLPALIGAFAYGPVTDILIELMKNALQLGISSTSGIGELANCIMGSSFAVTAGLIYKISKNKEKCSGCLPDCWCDYGDRSCCWELLYSASFV